MGGVQASVRWDNEDRYMVEQMTVHYMNSTLPRACRNFSHPTWDPSPEHSQFVHRYGPLRPDIDGHSRVTCPQQRNPQSSRLLLTLTVHTLHQVVEDLKQCPQDGFIVTPLWEHTAWSLRARRLCQEYHVLKPTQHRDTMPTERAKPAFLFQSTATHKKAHPTRLTRKKHKE